MEDDLYATFRELIRLPHGIILVTGPTGSGKSTTLYSALLEIKSDETKIITTEDPVEYQLEGINQIQVHPKIGLTFGTHAAEHPPARPGHHPGGRNPRPGNGGERHPGVADRAPGLQHAAHQRRGRGLYAAGRHGRRAVPGLQHGRGGDGPAAGARVVSALQRALPPEGATSCRPIFPWDALAAGRAPVSRGRLPRVPASGIPRPGRACSSCWSTTEEIRQLAHDRASSWTIQQAAVRQGMRTLRDDGWRKVLAGRTTIDEVLRVTKAKDPRA